MTTQVIVGFTAKTESSESAKTCVSSKIVLFSVLQEKKAKKKQKTNQESLYQNIEK